MISKSGFLLLLLLCIIYACSARECIEKKGCAIVNGNNCVCGTGCHTEYRYNSQNECYKALRARVSDICQRSPCKNGGSCSQIAHSPGYKCRCEGTAFYGQRCQYACPKPGAPLQGPFPYECVLI